MPQKPAKEFNDKAKSYLYSISVRPKYSRRDDFSAEIKQVAEAIRQLARDEGLSPTVRLKFDDGALGKLGTFFMNAPEKFAAKVKKLDGIVTVEKPTDRKAAPGSSRSSVRKPK